MKLSVNICVKLNSKVYTKLSKYMLGITTLDEMSNLFPLPHIFTITNETTLTLRAAPLSARYACINAYDYTCRYPYPAMSCKGPFSILGKKKLHYFGLYRTWPFLQIEAILIVIPDYVYNFNTPVRPQGSAIQHMRLRFRRPSSRCLACPSCDGDLY